MPCTIDTCVKGVCGHAPAPKSCPSGEYCDRGRGCIASPPCADTGQCLNLWGSDACKTSIACDPVTATCTFEALDKDGDGSAPIVCGGGDCDDTDPQSSVGAAEVCNGEDDDCDDEVDEGCACPSGQILCAGLCVDPEKDSKNCGSCKKDCGIGACEAGTCGPRVLAPGPGMRGLAVDATGVYFGLNNTIRKCSLTGCNDPPDTLATTILGNRLAVTADSIYVASGIDLRKVPKQGGKSTKIGTYSSLIGPTTSGGIICWSSSGTVYCGSSSKVASGGLVTDLAMDGLNVYWLDTNPVLGGVKWCQTFGCTVPQVLAPAGGGLGSIAVHSGELFWGVGGAIRSCSTGGCPSGSTVVLPVQTGVVKALTADASHVYFILGSPSGGVGALMRCPRTGCPNGPTMLADAQPHPGSVAVWEDAVYWVTGVGLGASSGGLLVMPK